MSKGDDELTRANRDAYLSSTKPPGPLLDLVADEEVAYTAYWLASVGFGPCDAATRRRGRVVGPSDLGPDFVRVDWGDGDPCAVNTRNLARPGPNLRYCRG